MTCLTSKFVPLPHTARTLPMLIASCMTLCTFYNMMKWFHPIIQPNAKTEAIRTTSQHIIMLNTAITDLQPATWYHANHITTTLVSFHYHNPELKLT